MDREKQKRYRGRKSQKQRDTDRCLPNTSERRNECNVPGNVAFVFSVQTVPSYESSLNPVGATDDDNGLFDDDRPSTSKGTRPITFDDIVPSSQSPVSPITPNEVDAVAERFDFLQRHVYYNDLIMRKIVGNVVNMHDRVTLEMCSRRLLHLSRTSAWMFTSRGNHFSMTYKTLNAHISVELGDVWFAVPSTTLETRRDLSEEQINQQHDKLMATLNGMAERFAKGIHTITIGGSDEGYREWGVRNHQLIVTEGLLRFINERLVNVQTVTFRECGFDRSAVAYLCSDAFSLPSRIVDLSLLAVWTDANILAADFARLVGANVRRLHLSKLIVDGIGSAIVERIRAVNCKLDDAMVTIGTYHRLTSDQSNWYVHAMARLCKSFRLRILSDVDKVPALMSLVRRITESPNLTELRMDHIPVSRTENESLAIMIENLPKLSSLRVLSLGGWQNSSIARSLAFGVRQSTRLEELTLRNIPPTPFEVLDDLFWQLPTSIHTLQLERMTSFHDDHLIAICERLPHLRSLTTSGLPKLSSDAIHDMLYYLPSLEFFHTMVPLSVEVALTLCDSETLPQLKRVEFACNHAQPDAMLALLRRFFTTVDCQSHHSNSRWSFIRLSDRLPSAPSKPDANIDLRPPPRHQSTGASKRKQQAREKHNKKMEWDSF